MMHPSINKTRNDLSPSSGKEELSPPDNSREKTSCYVEIMRPTIASSPQQKEDRSHETCTRLFLDTLKIFPLFCTYIQSVYE